MAAPRFVCKWGNPCLLRFGGTWNFEPFTTSLRSLGGPSGVDATSTSREALLCALLCISSRMEMDADASRSKRGTVIGEPHRVPRPNRPADGGSGSSVVLVVVRHEARDEAGSERPISICGRIRAEKFNLRFYIEPVRPYFWNPTDLVYFLLVVRIAQCCGSCSLPLSPVRHMDRPAPSDAGGLPTQCPPPTPVLTTDQATCEVVPKSPVSHPLASFLVGPTSPSHSGKPQPLVQDRK